jgi:hypothetical protein
MLLATMQSIPNQKTIRLSVFSAGAVFGSSLMLSRESLLRCAVPKPL